jgi:hypothetical protein
VSGALQGYYGVKLICLCQEVWCKGVDWIELAQDVECSCKHTCSILIFGVLLPVARALSRLSVELSFATAVLDVYFTYTSTAAFIGHLQAEHTICKEVTTLTRWLIKAETCSGLSISTINI